MTKSVIKLFQTRFHSITFNQKHFSYSSQNQAESTLRLYANVKHSFAVSLLFTSMLSNPKLLNMKQPKKHSTWFCRSRNYFVDFNLYLVVTSSKHFFIGHLRCRDSYYEEFFLHVSIVHVEMSVNGVFSCLLWNLISAKICQMNLGMIHKRRVHLFKVKTLIMIKFLLQYS